MPDLLDSMATEEKDLLDALAAGEDLGTSYDPSQPPTLPPRKEKLLVSRETTDKYLGLFKKGTWWGLGTIAWPFQRIEYTLATPLTKSLEERKKTLSERGIDKGFSLYTPHLIRKEDLIRESKEIVKILERDCSQFLNEGQELYRGYRSDNDFFSKTHCDRCGKSLSKGKTYRQHILSWFMEEVLCVGEGSCASKEDEIKEALTKQGKNTSDYEGCGYVPIVTNSGRFIAGEK